MKIRHLLCAACLLALYRLAFAADYGFPTPLRFAAGVDPTNPTEPFPYCFDYQERRVSGSNAASSFRATIVQDRRQFLRELNVSASASGSYTFFSGNASTTIDERYAFTSDSLTWIVLFQSDLGRKEVFGETPKQFAQDLLDAGRHSEFSTRCGTELVIEEYRIVTVAAVFTLKNLSTEQRSSLAAKLNASATLTAWSASASASYRSFVEEASQSSHINLEVVTVGGSGVADLAPLFTDLGDLQQVSDILRSYASKINFDNAQATKFTTTSMKRYGWNGAALDIGIQDISIGDYYLLYRDSEIIKERARSLLQEFSAGRISLSASQEVALRKAFSDSDKLMRRLIVTAKACRKDEASCVPVSQLPVLLASWPKTDPVGILVQDGKRLRCDSNGQFQDLQALFTCTQEVRYLAFARWGDVAGVDVKDRFGQTVVPVFGELQALADSYEAMRKRVGPDLTEIKFLEMVSGEKLSSLAEAQTKGWSARVLTVTFLFGAQSANTSGLRTTLNFFFTTGTGLRTERQLFMY